MKGLAIFGVLLGVVLFIGGWVVGTANGLVSRDEAVGQSYAQVQNVMQRQADLIPNLVETVKGYASHERQTLTAVIDARSKLSAVAKMDPAALANNPELQKQLIEAQTGMNQAMLNIGVLREQYPNLKADQQFTALMASLEGSINRITVERKKNQQAVQDYNVTVRKFPGMLIAGWLGYSLKPYFAASDAAQSAPVVRF